MSSSLLVQVLQAPSIIKGFSATQWNLLLRQASKAKMLSRVAYHINNLDLMRFVPQKILNHLHSEHVQVTHLHTQVNQELAELATIFTQLNIKAIYLKGTAYLLANLPLAKGRFFSDIDVLLAQDDIVKVEIALKCQGWISQKTNDHDQAYYRQYMHEIPPMQNILRGTIIDIHHNILPICNNNKLDISLLSNGAISLVNQHNHGHQHQILAPAAMFMHSAIHLFHEGELEQGLRGLSDLDMLFSYFDEIESDFSQQLIDLAKNINQQSSLFYAWRYLKNIFHRDLPKIARAFIDDYPLKPKHLAVLDFIFITLFTAHHSTTRSWRFIAAAQLAYWRGHLLRMPLRLLIPHLLKKSWLQLSELTKRNPINKHKIDALNPRFHPLDKN